MWVIEGPVVCGRRQLQLYLCLNATRFNKAQTDYHTRDKLLYFTIKFKSTMHTKGRIVVVAKGHNILTCIYISIYVSIKVRLSFPLWTTNFCKKCDKNSLPTRSCRLVIPREGYPAFMTEWWSRHLTQRIHSHNATHKDELPIKSQIFKIVLEISYWSHFS